MKTQLVAVPSGEPGGLKAALDPHFGHCPVYTLVELAGGKVQNVSTFENFPPENCGCAVSVKHLYARGINVLLAGGMGKEPWMTLKQAGVNVFYAGDCPTVEDAIDAYLGGKLKQFTSGHTCKDH